MGRLFRVVTYNVHKCKGIDGKVHPERIAAILKELDADVIALQEVLSIDSHARDAHQACFLGEALGMRSALGENRRLHGGAYGNVTLSRWPIVHEHNYDVTIQRREPRGVLRTDVEIPDFGCIHFFNAHLGTSFMERRHQGRKLVNEALLGDPDLMSPRIVAGDFNEWTRGLASRLLAERMEHADIKAHAGRSRSYPALMPIWHLDHVYHDPELHLERMALHRTSKSLVASDHLPVLADFRLE